VASKVRVGDGLSWHFGWRGLQVVFKDCDDLRLENLRTVNAIGFAMIASRCRNISADRIRIEPEGNQLAVGSRDGWKLYAGHGTVEIKNMHIEGVRWDGQNVHGSFLRVDQRLDHRTVLARKQFFEDPPIPPGTEIAFWNGAEEQSLRVTSAEVVRRAGRQVFYQIQFATPLPAFVAPETVASVFAWDIENYTLRDCSFEKIAGCASILRNRNVTFERCRFDNIMYPAVQIGASVTEGEGTFPQHVVLRECEFRDSGWEARQKSRGMIGIRTGGSELPFMRDILVENCAFIDAERGLDVAGASNVVVRGNRFERVREPWRVDRKSTRAVNFEGNRTK